MKHSYLQIKRTKVLSFLFSYSVLLLASCNKANELKPVNDKASSNTLSLQAGNKPNIIIILADDIGYDAIKGNGNETFKTPNLDKMIRDGMNFTHCYSSPLCSPSRTAFISGKYNYRNYTEWGVFDAAGKTFANIAQKAGYATYVAGKWQFDGGDAAAHRMGFDNYSIWNPIKADAPGRHYKDPKIYEKEDYLPKEKTEGKYGDDIFTKRVLSFIDHHKDENFFVFFPITLPHAPYSPTPDDPEFKSWNSRNPSDTSFFPSMVKYMDKKVGEIIDSLKKWDLYRNTIVMFSGDNGTPEHIFYNYNGKLREGGKSESNERGTRVPLIITWPKQIPPGVVNRNLIEFQDFLPTVAEATGAKITSDYGPIDGLSFYPQLIGASTQPHDWIFNHYQPNTNKGNDILKRWVQDTTYKLYESPARFYNIFLDPEEQNPISHTERTNVEKEIVKKFKNILDSLK